MFNLKKIFKSGFLSPAQFLGVDLGSSFVKAVVFETSPDGVKVLGIGYARQRPGALRMGVIEDLGLVEEAANLAIKEAEMHGQVFPKKAVFGLSGNGTFGATTTVRINRKDPAAKFSEKELLAIAKKVEETAFMEANRRMAERSGKPELEIDLTNSAICSTKIDGEFAADPVGMIGKQLEVGIFTAYSPLSFLTTLSDLAKDLDLEVLTISSNIYALVKALAANFSNLNAVILDIGGQATDLAVVFGGGVVATTSLGLGGDHLTQALMREMNLGFEPAEEKKILYAAGKLDSGESEKIASILRSGLELWVSGIELALNDFDGIKLFPAKFVLTGGGACLKDFSDAVVDYPWGKTVPLSGYLDLEVLTNLKMIGITDASGKFSGPGDIIPVSLGAVGGELLGS